MVVVVGPAYTCGGSARRVDQLMESVGLRISTSEVSRVAREAVVVAHAVHESGRREIIGLDVGSAETEAFWTEFLGSLGARDLVGVKLANSDAHEGLKHALGQPSDPATASAQPDQDGVESDSWELHCGQSDRRRAGVGHGWVSPGNCRVLDRELWQPPVLTRARCRPCSRVGVRSHQGSQP